MPCPGRPIVKIRLRAHFDTRFQLRGLRQAVCDLQGGNQLANKSMAKMWVHLDICSNF